MLSRNLFPVWCATLVSGIFAFLAPAQLVINEIHSNPDIPTDRAEFVELYNAGTNTLNLAGWRIANGVDYTFPPNTIVTQGGYVVVAESPTLIAGRFGLANVYGPFTNGLSKYGERLTLVDNQGVLVDEVQYGMGFPWPTVGDPPGYSIELIHPSLDNSLAGSWRASTNGLAGGPTPGRINRVYATNAPPQIRQVEHSPQTPQAGQVVRITAKITDPQGVASVLLSYQMVDPGNYIDLTDAAYTNTWTRAAMNDAGIDGDVTAGDGVYTAAMAASLQTHRRLIRYRIQATDGPGLMVQVPYADDPQPNFAYFVYNGIPAWSASTRPGVNPVLTFPAEEMNRLPAYHLISKKSAVEASTWTNQFPFGDVRREGYNWQGALVYDGQVYDHIRYRPRGGVWRYAMGKNMWKIDMNRGHDFQARDDWGKKFPVGWTKVNLGASIQQGDYNHRGEQGMFESVGMRMFNLAGIMAPKTSFITFRVIDEAEEAPAGNQFGGDFWGVYLAIEDIGGRMLEQRQMPDGNIYKMESGTGLSGANGTLENQGPTGTADSSDVIAFQAGLTTSATEAWWRANFNTEAYYSYQSIVQGIHHYDICGGKNFFYYLNPENRRWQVVPWDLDLSWAQNMYNTGSGCGGIDKIAGPLWGATAVNGIGVLAGSYQMSLVNAKPVFEREFRNRVREIRDLFFNTNQAFQLLDEYAALLQGPTNRPSIITADQAMWDYNPIMVSSYVNSSKSGQGKFYLFPNESSVNPALKGSFAAGVQIMKNYVVTRATHLDTLSTDATIPNTPVVSYGGGSNFPINRVVFRTSSFSSPTNYTFAGMKWRLAQVTTNTPAWPLAESLPYEIESPWGVTNSTFVTELAVPRSALRVGDRYRVRVQMTDSKGGTSRWSPPYEFTVGEPEIYANLMAYLRITEIMYNPPAGGFEYVELYNASPGVALDLTGVKFTQGIDYTFAPGTVIPPGGYLVLARTGDFAAFRSFYGLGPSVVVIGPYSGSLDNAGERLTLRTSVGGTDIVSFTYSDGRGWAATADGVGHSLVLDPAALATEQNGTAEYGGNWLPSVYLKGSPGRADLQPLPTVMLNEISANTSYSNPANPGYDSNDWIELYNPASLPVTLGQGWYLSDDPAALTKWQIPPGTVIPAHGFVTFDEVSGFHFPTNSGFGLSGAGEQLLLSYLIGTAEDRVVDSVSFKGQESGWSLGRYPDGNSYWQALPLPTPGTNNTPASPTVSVSEIQYHPPDIGTNDNDVDEFIEVYNPTAQPVMLATEAGSWRINGAVDFTFPASYTLAAGQYCVLVNFDPTTNVTQLAAFRSKYALGGATNILGPYRGGKLPNSSGRLAIERAHFTDDPLNPVTWVVVDEVIYADLPPWPCGADATGNSLHRFNFGSAGSNPFNWTVGLPTPLAVPGTMVAASPAITAQPQTRTTGLSNDVWFSVTLCGTPPFTYQWRFNGQPIANETNAVLRIPRVGANHAGAYDVLITNATSVAISAPAQLVVQDPPQWVVQPVGQSRLQGLDHTFTAQVSGTPPLSYLWRFNGSFLPDATNAFLTLTNLQPMVEGDYQVLIFNAAGMVQSEPAHLTVLVPPYFVVPPQEVQVRGSTNTADYGWTGSNVTLSVTASGTAPLSYQWRHDGALMPDGTNTWITLNNFSLAEDGFYDVVVANVAGVTSSVPVRASVLLTPMIVEPPVITNWVVVGGSVTWAVAVKGNPPPFNYQWRKSSIVLTNIPSNDTVGFFTLRNVLANQGGLYRVVITNPALTFQTLSAAFYLNVLADADGDGLPDVWETANSFSSTNANSKLVDSDGDGLPDWQEYLAGTDPWNPASNLRSEMASGPGGSTLAFQAVSNRTYSVEYSEGLWNWQPLANIVARRTNRVVNLLAPGVGTNRFYRIRTPSQ
jgi:hypothetical protein